MTHPIIDQYLRLAFHLDRHFPGFIDSYFGPSETKEAALAEPQMEPGALVNQSRALNEAVGSAEIPESRKSYLQKQITAMETIARKLAGEDIPYAKEVEGCFDIVPERFPDAVFEEAIGALDSLLPGSGGVADRMAAWRAGYVIDVDRARKAIEMILGETRRRTSMFAALPEHESIEIVFVTNQPWSGYNWYLGNAKSRVDINTDLPIHANDLVNLIAHEAYPGHHTEHCLKGDVLFNEQGFVEMSIQLINTPECVIHEGIATLAESTVFPDNEAAQWTSEVLYPAIGVAGAPAMETDIQRHGDMLRAVGGNAALMRHVDGAETEEIVDYLVRFSLRSEEECRHRLQFIDDPLWRPYIFTYHVGRDLLGAWLDQAPPADRLTMFKRLLTEQITPSQIREDLTV